MEDKQSDTTEGAAMVRSGTSESRASGTSRSAGKNTDELLREMEELRARLDEAEATVQAIHTGAVDALIVPGPDGEIVFALQGADYPYRVIVDVMNEGVVTLGSDGGILSCNSSFANFLKMPVEKILGRPLAGFTATEDMPKLRALLKEAAGKGSVVTTTLLLEDGTITPVKLSACAFEVGGLPALCVVVTDLTEMFAATETRLWLASIVETSNDAIVSLSLDDIILTWNAAAERIYGFSAQEAVGRSISLIVPCDHIQEIEVFREKICLGQHLEGYETLRITKSGASIHVSLTVSPLMDPKGNVTGVSVIARDITERKKSDAELEKYRQHLEEMVQQRTGELEAANAELESFSHSVSHDLRTPLRLMNKIAHMMLEGHGATLPGGAVDKVNMIIDATQEMEKLIESLLAFSQITRAPIKKRRIGLQRLAHEAIKELRNEQSGRTVEFVIEEFPPCHVDRTLFKQVFLNLLANALKFTRPREKAQIRIGFTETAGETVYFVRDNGVGFDMAKAGSLFLAFHRLHNPKDFEGSGIGLALVKRIIERHNGRIWGESEIDKGATFYFTLGE